MMKLYIGCSGFSYKEWKNEFYPAGLATGKWFEFYASQFNTLEVNLTFYNFPKLSILQNWYNKSPDDFLFAVKAPRLITHYKKFVDTKQLLIDFYGTCSDGLKDKLGPVLFQLPPSYAYTPERLQLILSELLPVYTNVIEFRHNSWWNKEVYDALAAKNIIFSGISHPSLPADIVMNGPQLYYRFHGVPKLYFSAYTDNELQVFAASVKQHSIDVLYCYFNNTAALAAINNARKLIRYLESKATQPNRPSVK